MRAFPSLQSMVLVDRNAALLSLAEKLSADGLPDEAAELRRADILTAALPPADLVTAGYVLAEIATSAQATFVQRLWEAARQALVLVEPGTPDGFARLQAARTALIAASARMWRRPARIKPPARWLVRNGAGSSCGCSARGTIGCSSRGSGPSRTNPMLISRVTERERLAGAGGAAGSSDGRGNEGRDHAARSVVRDRDDHVVRGVTRRSSRRSAVCAGEIPSRFRGRHPLAHDRSLTLRPLRALRRRHDRDRHPRPTTARPPPRRVRARPSAGQTVITAP